MAKRKRFNQTELLKRLVAVIDTLRIMAKMKNTRIFFNDFLRTA